VEASQYGWRDEKINKREDGPDTLHASETFKKRVNTQKRRKPKEPYPPPNLEIATPHNTRTKEMVSKSSKKESKEM
jgi:hypothetical protein